MQRLLNKSNFANTQEHNIIFLIQLSLKSNLAIVQDRSFPNRSLAYLLVISNVIDFIKNKNYITFS
jgi:hypothetical protein